MCRLPISSVFDARNYKLRAFFVAIQLFSPSYHCTILHPFLPLPSMNQPYKRRDQARSPRQIASRAYNLATKKINNDDRRKRHVYHMRERLLIQKTMVTAKFLLKTSSNQHFKVALSDAYDDYQTPLSSSQAPHHYPPPPFPSHAAVSPPSQEPEAFGTQMGLSSPPSPSSPPTLVPLVASSPKESSPSALHISQGLVHYLQWSLFDLLYYPPFIFWSSIFFLAREDCPSSNRSTSEFLPRSIANSAKEVDIS